MPGSNPHAKGCSGDGPSPSKIDSLRAPAMQMPDCRTSCGARNVERNRIGSRGSGARFVKVQLPHQFMAAYETMDRLAREQDGCLMVERESSWMLQFWSLLIFLRPFQQTRTF